MQSLPHRKSMPKLWNAVNGIHLPGNYAHAIFASLNGAAFDNFLLAWWPVNLCFLVSRPDLFAICLVKPRFVSKHHQRNI